MRPVHVPQNRPRRGFTLLEMLVVVALVVLLMTVLVSIFSAATSAISVSRAYAALDQNLRMLDGTIRRDLDGATAKFTPGTVDPRDNRGYFEYGENAFADLQGEDTDDYLRFTAKAPEGQPFTGRVWVPNGNQAIQPITFTSDYAEIIYFLRDGKLYRRVLLIAPERRTSLPQGGGNAFPVPTLGGFVGWQGMNDISARPNTYAGFSVLVTPVPNTLGDLTNRENRFPSPRFCDDFWSPANGNATPTDGISDDRNGDGVNDYYPTLYPNAIANLVNEAPAAPRFALTYDAMPFPYIFPGMYSRAAITNLVDGPLHSLDQTGVSFNHAPLEIGDSLPVPINANQHQTWWGFPTWKETMSRFWQDPVWSLNNGTGPLGTQPPGLSTAGSAFPYLVPSLPPSTSPFSDGAGTLLLQSVAPNLPQMIWEDDLIMTGVRSFDVKAYEPAPPPPPLSVLKAGYYDLGYLNQYTFTGLTTGAAPAAVLLRGFGHEGRIPPLPVTPAGSFVGAGDYRYNPQGALVTPLDYARFDVGDPSNTTLRLRRVFDTWSTAYTRAPFSSWTNPQNDPNFNPAARPIYPSFPPPYPAPLRGIQIQIRITDPQSEHVKVLTIRQDFSDKL
jgi:prepilin-type N-terminal cleavage/methylation domain-containing protein